MLQDATQQALETSRRTHEVAVRALDASGNETWNVLLGAGLALAGAILVFIIERAVTWYDRRRQRNALIYWFAYEAVGLASSIAGIARIVGYQGLPFATNYDMVPSDNVSKLIELKCPREQFEAVLQLQENTAGTFSMIERIERGFQRDQPGHQPVSYGWAAVHDMMRAFRNKRFESARSTSNILITGVRMGPHKKDADSLSERLRNAIDEFETALRDYDTWREQEIRRQVTAPRAGSP